MLPAWYAKACSKLLFFQQVEKRVREANAHKPRHRVKGRKRAVCASSARTGLMTPRLRFDSGQRPQCRLVPPAGIAGNSTRCRNAQT